MTFLIHDYFLTHLGVDLTAMEEPAPWWQLNPSRHHCLIHTDRHGLNIAFMLLSGVETLLYSLCMFFQHEAMICVRCWWFSVSIDFTHHTGLSTKHKYFSYVKSLLRRYETVFSWPNLCLNLDFTGRNFVLKNEQISIEILGCKPMQWTDLRTYFLS